ncbi:TrmJ/YjtD family RNA methyltransferase [Sphingomonas solaris]|uniref:tRNA (cytidine/uridine-2'-O-)-methyltransferase TrmJ n=1 Tax=Alterirhizorhabdus solaris TaxID=2529389 RepID=A0A558QZC9_9SPHN|nr:TrmJ/YjtD family RNA methyltransferase [Sphingomonas solaris]TVV72516.1 TrmJ/YjtD family RNA methyltransferase [Sphingomonas solaris]
MSFHTYMLQCADGSYYVGHTDDLETRLAQHQAGEAPGYTHNRRPVTLVWSEDFSDREQAFAVEKQLKGWSRAKKEALIEGDWETVRSLARRVLRDEPSPGSVSPQDERRGDGQGAPPPAIVLVRPQLGENIGKAARAMLNFGLTELRLVSPRDGWPNPAAGPAASGADSVLAGAKVYETVAEATADCAHVYATTVRKRGVILPVVTPETAAHAIRSEAGRSAILFGPERSGLETDDVAVARTIVTVPINPEFGSLNLAQAVILVAYEWSKGEALASPPSVEQAEPAPQAELDRMIAHLDGILETAGYFFPPDRAHVDRRALRTILTSPGWNAGEIRTLRGMLRSIERSQK